MAKIYYDKTTGFLCNRYPKDLEITDSTPFIEVDEETEAQTYVVEYGKFWAVVNGSLQKIDDAETQATEEYKNFVKKNKIAEYQSYLDSTDYIISKLNELKLDEDATYEAEKAKYTDVLAKRKEYRKLLNELKGE